MADDLVYEQQVDGPATHALVIGVGDYQYLTAANGRSTRWGQGMQSLRSPPISARAFTDWMIREYHIEGCPLATVALLLSDDVHNTYTPPGGRAVQVQRANTVNVLAAIVEWYGRGHTNPGNRLVFYFCGHGAIKNAQTSLFLEDYAGNERFPLAGALDFHWTYTAMQACAARSQVYFIDACRGSITALNQALDGDMGRRPEGIFQFREAETHSGLKAPIFYSTLEGDSAWGRQGQVSQYTEALCKALRGAADRGNRQRKWLVEDELVNRCVRLLLKREAEKGAGVLQLPSIDKPIGLVLHEPRNGPFVPVAVYCTPTNAAQGAQLYWQNDGQSGSSSEPGRQWGWDLALVPGTYRFEATTNGGKTPLARTDGEAIVPVYSVVNLEAQS